MRTVISTTKLRVFLLSALGALFVAGCAQYAEMESGKASAPQPRTTQESEMASNVPVAREGAASSADELEEVIVTGARPSADWPHGNGSNSNRI